MENRYQRAKETLKNVGKIALVIYAIGGSLAYSNKTGHQSADLTTGVSQPTKLEKFILESFDL